MENERTPQQLHAQNLDRMIHAGIGRVTHGLSPASLVGAYMDWLVHLAIYPGKQQELAEKAIAKLHRLALYSVEALSPDTPPCIEPLPQDRRFSDPAWQQWPFNVIHQAFLLEQQWWHNATSGVRGVTRHHQQVVTFAARQWLDMVSPSNFIFTNPEVLQETVRTGGMNFVLGAVNLWKDMARTVSGAKPEHTQDWQVGKNVAVTPGRVVLRNQLVELIQYAPATREVHAEPILIVPSWIMKYYILDLSPANSLVRYLVEQGHTVFMVSWKNPEVKDRELGMDDYLKLGVLAALDAVKAIIPGVPINLTGYCLGGTLSAIAAAKLARDARDGLNSLSLLATQVDFDEPGELSLFIDESQITFLEDIMWDQGYLSGDQMGGAFALLNSQDLIWSRLVHDYLLGKRRPVNDLMAWNADSTRMPYRMHAEYLRRLYLENELARGRYAVDGRPVALTDIRTPIFAVSTVRDHVSPWHSVFRIHLLTDTDVTFVLTSGGHNAGIVSEPGHRGRSYQVATAHADSRYMDPDTWHAATPTNDGSWWPEWAAWLAARSTGLAAPPSMGAPEKGLPPLEPAPGRHVLAA